MTRITHHASRNNRISERFLIMLALLAAFLIGPSGAHAQSNTEYSFRQQSVLDGDRYSDDDDAAKLSMDCIAANGYGQWTLSSQTGNDPAGGSTQYVKGWYLLANGLYKPSIKYDAGDPTDYPGCYPPGIVQNAALVGDIVPTEPKATANLDGAVNYVWPDATRQTFDVQGFRQPDVDLSFSFLSNPHPPLKIIAGTIHGYPAVTTETGILFHNVVATAPYQDEFDVCSDAAYLYITWCSTTHMTPPITTSEIWYEVLDINTLTPVLGPASAGAGMRPTISCDPRDNRNGGTTIHFDLAFIAPVSGSWLTSGGLTGGMPVWEDYNAGIWTTYPATINVLNPAGGMSLTYYMATHVRALVSSVASGGWYPACYAIVEGFSGDVLSPVLILYNQLDPKITPLGFAAYVDGNLMPPYGIPLGNPNPTDPIPAPQSPQIGWPVKDAPIVAMANPYDNQNISSNTPSDWQAYDQFHCLYQLDLSQSHGQPPSEINPLLIVRNSDNGEANPTQPNPAGGTPDTRLVLNQVETTPPPPLPQLLPDPGSYCAAVNQMGIHVHWRTSEGVHFYSRDTTRAFDEDVDENTLVTDICTVSDGSAHGGTVGAELLDDKRMSVWTDPNYGAAPTDLSGNSGLYQPNDYNAHSDALVGQLDFVGDNAVLTIGGLSNSDGGSVLTDMPYFYLDFFGDATGRGVTVGPNSTFDYYGLVPYRSPSYELESPFRDVVAPGSGEGTISLQGGSTSIDWPPYTFTAYPAILNVHGGSDFTEFQGTILNSDVGEINVLYQPNIYPEDPYNSNATGHLSLQGVTRILDNSEMHGNIPTGSQVILTVQHGADVNPQFDAESSIFDNTPLSAASELLMEFHQKGFYGINFNGDACDAIKIHAINPKNEGLATDGDGDITIKSCSFKDIHGRCIFIENTLAPTGLDESQYNGQINITNNQFQSINPTLDLDDAAHGTYGVYIKGYDGNFDLSNPDLAGTIMIEHNVFIYSSNWTNIYPNYPDPGNNQYSAAICFDNTTGNIISNNIQDPAWTKGIWLMGTPWGGSYYTSNSFLCSNFIKNLHAPSAFGTSPAPQLLTGIQTEYHTGMVKLNTITNCEIGYYTTGIGWSHLDYSTIDDYDATSPHTYDIQQAIRVTSPGPATNHLDLSGDHGNTSSPPDNGAFNTVRATYDDYSIGMITIGTNSELILGNTHQGFTWTQYGQNNLFLCTSATGASTQPLDNNAYILKGLAGTASALGDIDFNFWGIDGSSNKIDPANEIPNGTGRWNAAQTSQFNESNTAHSPQPSSARNSESSFTGVVCGTNYAIASPPKGPKPQSMQQDAFSRCDMAFNIGDALSHTPGANFAASYDSLKYAHENCYDNSRAPDFQTMEIDVQEGGIGTGPDSWTEFRQWLLSVLPIRHDATWFCSDLFAIGGTYSTVDTSYAQVNTATNKAMSVLYWLIHNSPCLDSGLEYYYINGRGSQEESWFNTQDTSKVKLDTTIYSMQDLGLDSVLKYAGLLGVNEGNTPSILSNASASPNPAGTGTEIYFSTSREAYVKIDLFNLLGVKVGAAGFESVVQPGNHEVPLSLSGLPSGTYYARIVTTYGEVQTVKLVKE